MRYLPQTTLTLEERIRSGGLLTIPEFCSFAAVSRVGIYKQIKKGKLKVVKNGRSTRVAGQDASPRSAGTPPERWPSKKRRGPRAARTVRALGNTRTWASGEAF